MYTKMLLIIFLLMTNLTIFAQREFKITPKIGISTNSVYGHIDGVKWAYKFSPILLGTEFSFAILDNLEFAPELSYARKGAFYKDNNNSISQNYIFDYLILSSNFKWQPWKKENTKFLFGPYYGLCTNAKVQFDAEGEFWDYRKNSTFKSYDTGINLAIAQKLKLGNLNFIIEPRFQLGLIRFSHTRHRSFQLMFGVEI